MVESPDNDDLSLRAQLREVGARRRAASDVLKATMDELVPLVRAAKAADVSISDIAKDTGLSRPTIYEILRGG